MKVTRYDCVPMSANEWSGLITVIHMDRVMSLEAFFAKVYTPHAFICKPIIHPQFRVQSWPMIFAHSVCMSLTTVL